MSKANGLVRLLGGLGLLAFAIGAAADTGPRTGLNAPATASLKFAIEIDKFVFLRIGNTGEGNANTVAFAFSPTIPGGPTTPAPGGNTPLNWNGAAPSFAVAATPIGSNALPVEVRSNGGTVTLRASTTTQLSSGSNTIPMSQVTVTTSDAALPAPLLLDAVGAGGSASVTGNNFSNRVTSRSATWTFGYAPTPAQMPRAGNYNGEVTFTASVL